MAKKLWGGRFGKKVDAYFEAFSSSIETDCRLVKCDLIGSLLHVHVLAQAGLLKPGELSRFKKAILGLLSDVQKGAFEFDFSSEDIHTNIQNLLSRKVGPLALKLQTCRSRNDQVVFDTKLYCLFSGSALQNEIFVLRKSLIELEILHSDLVMPGYTHLQHAQPVFFKDVLGAYSLMLERDAERLEDALLRLRPSMGSGALAGTPIPAAAYKTGINKGLKVLKMTGLASLIRPAENSLATVSDRDFVIEILSVTAQVGIHLSRMAEDLILWSTREFGFIEIGDEYCTGSSLMPQKKNPDALELIRGASGLLSGHLVSALTLMKGLPLSYNRDMQWDKVPLFSSLELTQDLLVIMAGLFKTLKVNKEKIKSQANDEALAATDLADYLVHRGLAFSKAHEAIGRLVRYSVEKEKPIAQMTQDELFRFSPLLIQSEVLRRLDPVFCARSKKSVSC